MSDIQHPGHYLRLMMDKHCWAVRTVACAGGIPFNVVRNLLSCRVRVDGELAAKLSRATGASADYWLVLQEQWDSRRSTLK